LPLIHGVHRPSVALQILSDANTDSSHSQRKPVICPPFFADLLICSNRSSQFRILIVSCALWPMAALRIGVKNYFYIATGTRDTRIRKGRNARACGGSLLHSDAQTTNFFLARANTLMMNNNNNNRDRSRVPWCARWTWSRLHCMFVSEIRYVRRRLSVCLIGSSFKRNESEAPFSSDRICKQL